MLPVPFQIIVEAYARRDHQLECRGAHSKHTYSEDDLNGTSKEGGATDGTSEPEASRNPGVSGASSQDTDSNPPAGILALTDGAPSVLLLRYRRLLADVFRAEFESRSSRYSSFFYQRYYICDSDCNRRDRIDGMITKYWTSLNDAEKSAVITYMVERTSFNETLDISDSSAILSDAKNCFSILYADFSRYERRKEKKGKQKWTKVDSQRYLKNSLQTATYLKHGKWP